MDISNNEKEHQPNRIGLPMKQRGLTNITNLMDSVLEIPDGIGPLKHNGTSRVLAEEIKCSQKDQAEGKCDLVAAKTETPTPITV